MDKETLGGGLVVSVVAVFVGGFALLAAHETLPTKPGVRTVAVSPQYNIEATFKTGYAAGQAQRINEAVIKMIGDQNYRMAWREGFQRGADVACGAAKGFEGETFEEAHPSPQE